MKRYFAYGSNMNQGDLDTWCEENDYSKIRFQSWQRAVLNGYKLDFTHCSGRRKGGTADVTCPGEFVEGVLFEASEEDMKLLDDKEGGKAGIYKRINVEVKLEDGKKTKAITYQVCNPEPFQAPHKDYLKVIIDGARAYRLSDGWIHKLKQIPTSDVDPCSH